MRAPAMPASWRSYSLWVAGLLVVFGLAVAAIYWGLRGGPFAQDDLGLLAAMQDPERSVLDKVFATDANRFRPVTNAGYLLTFEVMGNNFVGWWAANVLLLAAVAAIAAVVVWWLSTNLFVGLVVGSLITATPFASYQVVMATGQVESLALLWFALTATGVVVFARTQATWGLVLSAVAFTLLVFTHERFQLFAIALVVFILVCPNVRQRARLWWSIAFLAPVVALTAIKALIVGMPLLVGSGTATEVGFSWDTTIAHAVSAVAQLFGVNWGPPLFTGRPITELEPWLQGVSFGVAALTVLLLIAPVTNRFAGANQGSLVRPMKILGVLLVAGITLLVPIIITSRLEQRWLMSLYVLMLGCIGYLVGRAVNSTGARANRHGARAVTLVLLTLFATGALILDTVYRQSMAPLHFMGNKGGTTALVDQLRPAWTKAGSDPVYVVDAAMNPTWGAMFNQSMGANTDLGERRVAVVASLRALPTRTDELVAFLAQPGSSALVRLDEPTAGVEPLVIEGPVYPDGWAGPRFSVASTSPACTKLVITAQSAPWGTNEIEIVTNTDVKQAGKIGAAPATFTVPLEGAGSVATIRFSRGWIPEKINAGEDPRTLSARVTLACAE